MFEFYKVAVHVEIVGNSVVHDPLFTDEAHETLSSKILPSQILNLQNLPHQDFEAQKEYIKSLLNFQPIPHSYCDVKLAHITISYEANNEVQLDEENFEYAMEENFSTGCQGIMLLRLECKAIPNKLSKNLLGMEPRPQTEGEIRRDILYTARREQQLEGWAFMQSMRTPESDARMEALTKKWKEEVRGASSP